MKGQKDKENLSARCLNQIKTTSFYDKKMRETPSRDRSIESYRSPSHASKKPLNTEPLTARNFNDSRVHSKTPTKKTKRPVYENVICITSPGKQDVPIKLTANQPLQTKYLREYENSLSRLAKAANSQSSRPKVPPIALRNFGQGQCQGGGLHFVSTIARVKKENNPMAKAKLESQMLLKR